MPFVSSTYVFACLYFYLLILDIRPTLYICVRDTRAHVRIYKYICIVNKSTKTNKLTDISTLNI